MVAGVLVSILGGLAEEKFGTFVSWAWTDSEAASEAREASCSRPIRSSLLLQQQYGVFLFLLSILLGWKTSAGLFLAALFSHVCRVHETLENLTICTSKYRAAHVVMAW